MPSYTDPAVLDPFTETYQAQLKVLTSWAPLMKIVGINNIQDLSQKNVTTLKDLLTSSDTNGLLLLQGKSKESPFGSNNMVAEISQDYTIIAASDLLSIVPINQLKWQIFKAYVNGASDNFGLPYVQSFDLAGGDDSTMTPIEQIAASKRWAHVKTCVVKMKFSLQSLR